LRTFCIAINVENGKEKLGKLFIEVTMAGLRLAMLPCFWLKTKEQG
jgi:hypothetical protein